MEITEEWDKSGQPLNIPTFPDDIATTAEPQKFEEVEEESVSDDELGTEEDIDEFENDAFEAMMQEMETLEMESSLEHSSTSTATPSPIAKSIGNQTPTIKEINTDTNNNQTKGTSPGLKKGFLLGKGGTLSSGSSGSKNDTSVPSIYNANAPTAPQTASGPVGSSSTRSKPILRGAAFTGAVVERNPIQPESTSDPSGSLQETPLPSAPTTSLPEQKPQRISKFKQRMQS